MPVSIVSVQVTSIIKLWITSIAAAGNERLLWPAPVRCECVSVDNCRWSENKQGRQNSETRDGLSHRLSASHWHWAAQPAEAKTNKLLLSSEGRQMASLPSYVLNNEEKEAWLSQLEGSKPNLKYYHCLQSLRFMLGCFSMYRLALINTYHCNQTGTFLFFPSYYAQIHSPFNFTMQIFRHFVLKKYLKVYRSCSNTALEFLWFKKKWWKI